MIAFFMLILALAVLAFQILALRLNDKGAWGLNAFWWQVFATMLQVALVVTLILVLLP